MNNKPTLYRHAVRTGYYISPEDVSGLVRWLVQKLYDLDALKADVNIVDISRLSYGRGLDGDFGGLCLAMEVGESKPIYYIDPDRIPGPMDGNQLLASTEKVKK